MNYDECVAERNNIQFEAHTNNKYLNFSQIVSEGEGAITAHHNSTHYYHLQMPECDLQKELDNVRYTML